MSMTAEVHLDRVYITLAGNVPEGVIAGSAGSVGGGGSRVHSRSMDGEFRTYANGIVRLLTGTGVSHTHSLALRALTPTQVTQILSMAGKTCLFRDSYGARFYGSFLASDLVVIPFSGATADTQSTDFGLTITEITYVEGV